MGGQDGLQGRLRSFPPGFIDVDIRDGNGDIHSRLQDAYPHKIRPVDRLGMCWKFPNLAFMSAAEYRMCSKITGKFFMFCTFNRASCVPRLLFVTYLLLIYKVDIVKKYALS